MTNASENQKDTAPQSTAHYRLFQWHRTRAITSTLILILTLVGTLVIDNHPKNYWNFSWIMVLFDSCLIHAFLTYCRLQRFPNNNMLSFWQLLQHWALLFAAIYGVSVMINTGLLKPIQAGIVTTLIFGLSCCHMGLRTDRCLVAIGALFLILAPLTALITEHFMLSALPLIAATAVVLFALIATEHMKHRQ